MKTPALFLDRDGVLIEDQDYLSRVDQVRIFPGTAAALKKVQDAGYGLFIVTNQSGVGRGYFTMEDVRRVHDHLLGEFAKAGVQIRKIYIAPEAPDQPSRGRKPSPQFLWEARDEFGLDLARSFMVGDKWIDLQCGWNAGVRKSLLVRTGYGARVEANPPEGLQNAVICDTIVQACDWILNQPSLS